MQLGKPAKNTAVNYLDASVHNRSSFGSSVTAPAYILESSRSSQNLWNLTAGNRPPQPEREREYFETEWIKNFSKSNVDYSMSRSDLLERSANDETDDDEDREVSVFFIVGKNMY